MKRGVTGILLFLLFAACFIPADHSKKLKEIAKTASDSIPSMGSFLVWHNGKLVCEEYFNESDSATEFNVKSVTKSVVSALAGIAHDRKMLPDVNTPLLDILPEYGNDTSVLKKQLRLRDVLTMRLGILWDDFTPKFWKSDDGIRDYLEIPFADKPGSTFRYSTPGSHIMGVAVARSVNAKLFDFADTVLFKPAGMQVKKWPTDKLGRNNGGSELHLRACDMVKFGLLYLNGGKVKGKQVISEEWIKESTSEQVVLNEWDVLPGANGYGYYWWRRLTQGHQAWVASGYGGQLICVIPDLKMVIVTTCYDNEKNRGRSEIKRLHGFMDEVVKLLGN